MLARLRKISPETAATVIVKSMENGGKAGCIGGAMWGSYRVGRIMERDGFKYPRTHCYFNGCDKCFAAGCIAMSAAYYGSAGFLWPITIPYFGLRSFLSWRKDRVVDA